MATGDLAGEIARLKQEPGKNIYVSGGATLGQSLSRLGLIDEYTPIIQPVVLGGGKPHFADRAAPLNLKLVNTRAFDSGSVQLSYERI
ncbi:MAG TPA: dihydrofolate reductase family protein [Ktedonobacterales bacterium]|nr:dihydrofolate reductase family protein [Ktedonobacterales bacterium]